MPVDELSIHARPTKKRYKLAKKKRYRLSSRKKLLILGVIILLYPVIFIFDMFAVVQVILPYEIEVTVFSEEFKELYILLAPALCIYLTRGSFPRKCPRLLKILLQPWVYRFLWVTVLLSTAFCVAWMFRLYEFFFLDAFVTALGITMFFTALLFCALVFGNPLKPNWQKSAYFLLCSIQLVLACYKSTLFNLSDGWLEDSFLRYWCAVIDSWPLVAGALLCVCSLIAFRFVEWYKRKNNTILLDSK